MLDKGLSRLGEGGIGVFDEASGDCVFGGSLEDLAEGGFTLGAGGGFRKIFKEGISFKGEGVPICFTEVVESFDRAGVSVDFRKGEEDGEMIRTEGGEGVPGKVKGKVGRAKGKVGGGGLAVGGEAGGGVLVEEAEAALIESFQQSLPTIHGRLVKGDGVPGRVVGIEITD